MSQGMGAGEHFLRFQGLTPKVWPGAWGEAAMIQCLQGSSMLFWIATSLRSYEKGLGTGARERQVPHLLSWHVAKNALTPMSHQQIFHVRLIF